MKKIYGLEPDLVIRHPEIIIHSTIDIVLPKYFYNQLIHLKNGNFQDATEIAANILSSLVRQSKHNLLIFRNHGNGTVYFIDEVNYFINHTNLPEFDIHLPLDRYLLSLLSFSNQLKTELIFFATSYQVVEKCRSLGFFVVSKGMSVISGKSFLQSEILFESKISLEIPSELLLQERYRIIKPMTQGTTCKTFLALDEGKPSKPSCIIKKMSMEITKLEHLPGLNKCSQLPKVLDYFIQDDQQYLVQKFVDGVCLAQELTELGSFQETKIRQLLNDLLLGLQFLHTAGFIHGDIKPQNIIRRCDNQLVLVDFAAISLTSDRSLKNEKIPIGNPEYAAPEQLMGRLTFASDLYSLGMTCIHLLTMLNPFDLLDSVQLNWVWRDYLVDNPVSHQLGYVLDKLVERSAEKRYQSATEALGDLHPQPIHWFEQKPLSQIQWQDKF
jgi:Protein kinase domain